MQKIISFVGAWLLIGSGGFLEVKYYIDRFRGDGIDFYISLIIGCALTLFLCMSVYSRNKKISKALSVSLIIYSILATSAGQHFSFQESKNENVVEEIQSLYTEDEITDKQNQIKQIDDEINKLNETINASITNLEDMWYYKNTIASIEKTKTELKDRRKEIQTDLESKTGTAKIHKDVKQESGNIYQFYNKLTLGFFGEAMLQFFFQTLLSFFIAMMAPLGIQILTNEKYKRPVKKIIPSPNPEKIKLSNDLIKQWIRINWVGFRNKKTNKIISRESFEKFMENKKEVFTREIYDVILNRAVKGGVIYKTGIIIEPDENKAFKKIINLT